MRIFTFNGIAGYIRSIGVIAVGRPFNCMMVTRFILGYQWRAADPRQFYPVAGYKAFGDVT